jgi:methylmalonyl-CoA mutase cobalamin-binding subunit
MQPTLETLIRQQTARWREAGLPGHDGLIQAAAAIAALRAAPGTRPLWRRPPLMLTATLDDALGQGLAVIHRFADAVGLRRHHLGLALSPEVVIDACRAQRPSLLGMTVLQFDTQTDLACIRRRIPAGTRMVCGGPIFKADAHLAARCGIDFVAAHAGAFLDYLLDLQDSLR